jgi:hypothetical protein
MEVGKLGSLEKSSNEHGRTSNGREQKLMPDKKQADRRTRQAQEVEASQKRLRESIATTSRLVEESDKMLRRHRKERGDDEAEG